MRAIHRVVLLQIRIEEIDRDAMPGDALQVVAPCANRDRAPFEGDRDHRVFGGQNGLRIPRLGFSDLHARYGSRCWRK